MKQIGPFRVYIFGPVVVWMRHRRETHTRELGLELKTRAWHHEWVLTISSFPKEKGSAI